ncbi:hypothetical protein HDU91_001726, partial [Kappamyces sp. JEL0680]
ILHTTRLFTKKGKLPSWGASLLSIPEAYILEVSTVDPKTKTMHIRTRNLSHRKLLLVEEDQTIRPVGASPLETACSIKVRFISNSSFSPLRNQIEGWGLNRFKGTTLNSSKGLDHVLHSLKAQFERSPASRITSASTRSRADSDDESYARSSASHDSNLIQPWNYVKTVIQKTVGSKAVEVAGSQDGETKSMVPITLSHGFQPIRTMENLKPGIRGVHYLPGSSMFVSLDKEWLSLWKGGTRIQRIPAIPPPPSTTKTLEVKKSIEGLYGFSKWVYIETLRIYVVASQQLELKVLNSTFGTVSVTSTPKPVLCMEFIHATGMLVLGEIEGLRILSIKRTTTGHVEMIDLVEHRAIAFPDEWISCVLYDARRHALFAGCGSSLYVFDYESGSKIDSYYGIHDLSITQLAYYEPSEYLITGAKDGNTAAAKPRHHQDLECPQEPPV